jgi:hypothetical protein
MNKLTIFALSLLMLVLGSISGSLGPHEANANSPKKKLLVIPTGQTAIVGTLVSNGSLAVGSPKDFCLEDGRLWEGSSWRLADRHVFGLKDTWLKGAILETVVLFGAEKMSLDDKVVVKGPCPESHVNPPPMQLRSDWLAPETSRVGHSTHDILKKRPYWEATGLHVVEMVKAEILKSGDVEARVFNPFAFDLRGVTLVWHYEGGPGKPMPHFEKQKIVVPAGATVTFRRPRRIKRQHPKRGPAHWSLHMVLVKANHQRLSIRAQDLLPRASRNLKR